MYNKGVLTLVNLCFRHWESHAVPQADPKPPVVDSQNAEIIAMHCWDDFDWQI